MSLGTRNTQHEILLFGEVLHSGYLDCMAAMYFECSVKEVGDGKAE